MIWNPEAETAAPAVRRTLQVERLRATIDWARTRVPFHQARLGSATVASLDDLEHLPFMKKTDLREHYPFGLGAVPVGELARIHASSGTKGKPTIVGYTRGDLDVWREVMARVMVAAGARSGDLLQIAFGYGLFTGGLGFHQGAEQLGMTVVPASSAPTARQHLLLADLRPAGLCATPSFALHVAEAMRAAGGDPGGVGLRYGLFGAEPWTEGVRQALERAWGCPAFDIYGLSEIVGPGVAGECEARAGLHVCDDHFLPEVIDPGTGARCVPGEQGELVLTTLTKRALPMIRYRTGDVTVLFDDPCRCGRTSVRIARIKGRTDDMLVVRGVNVYPSEIEAALLALGDLDAHWQVVLDRRDTLPRLEVLVEPGPELVRRVGGFAAQHPAVVTVQQATRARLREVTGLSIEVMIVAPGTVPRSEGKAVRVIERR